MMVSEDDLVYVKVEDPDAYECGDILSRFSAGTEAREAPEDSAPEVREYVPHPGRVEGRSQVR